MAEWLKATECTFVGISYIGSNPIFFIKNLCNFIVINFRTDL